MSYHHTNRQSELSEGDLVMIKYRDSKYFNHIGKIYYMKPDGDCMVSLEYGGYVTFYKSHLIKIIQLIEIPSGEVFYISYNDCIDLAASNLLEYDFEKRIYIFRSNNIWQIEEYIL